MACGKFVEQEQVVCGRFVEQEQVIIWPYLRVFWFPQIKLTTTILLKSGVKHQQHLPILLCVIVSFDKFGGLLIETKIKKCVLSNTFH